ALRPQRRCIVPPGPGPQWNERCGQGERGLTRVQHCHPIPGREPEEPGSKQGTRPRHYAEFMWRVS
ncbi:MAG TPA: hypothetical protein VMW20_04405, partial [Candidatus Nanoarchaeia archaeon]|nr:hypothetical protein [Candidatus Nanoarchaeia archaeon]